MALVTRIIITITCRQVVVCGPQRTVSPATRRAGTKRRAMGLADGPERLTISRPQYAYAQGADRCDRSGCRRGGDRPRRRRRRLRDQHLRRIPAVVARCAKRPIWGPTRSSPSCAFPFIPQAMRDHYNQLEIKANAVDHADDGKATLEATMHSIDLTYASWLIRPDAKLPVGKLESRIIIDSTHLGRYLGIADLMVEAPPHETNNATGGTTESGISGSHGLVFSGTPKSANFDHRVSVVDGPLHRRRRPGDAGVHPHRHPHRARHRQPNRSRRQAGRGAARVRRQAARSDGFPSASRRPPWAHVAPTSSSKASPRE